MGLGRVCLLLFFQGISISCGSELETQRKAEIDKIFASYNTSSTPGCAIGIYRNGAIWYQKGYGMANISRNIPLSPRSVFEIASVSKHFTSVAILLLEEKGVVRLNEKVTRYVPELPERMSGIQISHLLHHTSGMKDYLDLAKQKGLGDYFTVPQAVDLIAHSELNFAPNDQYEYSNSGYFLLSKIVEKATGKSLRRFSEENIFRPLGMRVTHFHDRNTETVSNLAVGYAPDEGGFVEEMTKLEMVGDGGLYTSIEDFEKWEKNYYSNQLGKKRASLFDSLTTSGALNNGQLIGYGKGLRLGTYKGFKVQYHGGSFVGYRAAFLRFPTLHTSIALLCNRRDAPSVDLAFAAADLLLKR